MKLIKIDLREYCGQIQSQSIFINQTNRVSRYVCVCMHVQVAHKLYSQRSIVVYYYMAVRCRRRLRTLFFMRHSVICFFHQQCFVSWFWLSIFIGNNIQLDSTSNVQWCTTFDFLESVDFTTALLLCAHSKLYFATVILCVLLIIILDVSPEVWLLTHFLS